MKDAIIAFKMLRVNRFVFGILNADGSINIAQNKILVDLARPVFCTFHRAFDGVVKKKEALQQLIDIDFNAVLTSGRTGAVADNIAILRNLQVVAANHIIVMPGGNLRSDKSEYCHKHIGATFYHSAAIVDDSEYANGREIELLKASLKW